MAGRTRSPFLGTVTQDYALLRIPIGHKGAAAAGLLGSIDPGTEHCREKVMASQHWLSRHHVFAGRQVSDQRRIPAWSNTDI
jgi:hypothetical protein